jgi:hypothetical protein
MNFYEINAKIQPTIQNKTKQLGWCGIIIGKKHTTTPSPPHHHHHTTTNTPPHRNDYVLSHFQAT